MRQSTFSLTTRASWVFTPNLSFQLYAQPFVSAGRYQRLREVADPRARRFDDRFPLIAGATRNVVGDESTYRIDRNGDGRVDYTIDDPDFTIREVRANAVLRWEYRPGSMLFVVWSQQRSRTDPTAELDAWRNPGELFGVPGPSALLVKLSYWLKR